MTRFVRHRGSKFHSTPLSKHVAYLKREGVTRDGADARMFDPRSDDADMTAFPERCDDESWLMTRFAPSPAHQDKVVRIGLPSRPRPPGTP
jgi:type IV secretory pathway VirD2 relaxase